MISYHLSHLKDLFHGKGNQRGLIKPHIQTLLSLYDNGDLNIEASYYLAFKKITYKLNNRQFAWVGERKRGLVEYQILFFALKSIIDESNLAI